MRITLLNTSVLTSYGVFDFRIISLEEAIKLVKTAEIVSAIGHAATAEILSELLGTEIKANRFDYVQEVGETALVFKLKSRISEGKILNRQEIENIGYEFGTLKRIK